jgi:tRNA/rRNA methyltransferase
MTPRDFGPPTTTPREHFEALSKKKLSAQVLRGLEADLLQNVPSAPVADEVAPESSGIGFLFGSERFGMRNEDVYRCHVCLSIPSNPQFGSLNLGAALQVIAYDWREALAAYPVQAATTHAVLADAAQVSGMLAHLEQALTHISFLDPASPKKLMPRLNQLFNRAQLTQEEVHILRGMAKMMIKPQPLPMSGSAAQD